MRKPPYSTGQATPQLAPLQAGLVTSLPLWFDAAGTEVFGWMDYPSDRQVKGAVVLCPALGSELISAHDTFHDMARALAAEGLLVLRFDYPGTGDSVDPGDPREGLVRGGTRAIIAATRLVRDTGVARVALVGMRMGATLATCAAPNLGALDGLILWDPCTSGTSFLRQQRALLTLSDLATAPSAPGEDDPIEIPGYVFSQATAAELASLELTDPCSVPAESVLLLLRERASKDRLLSRFARPETEWGRVDGQADLLDISTFESVIPVDGMRRIVAWLSTKLVGTLSPFETPTPRPHAQMVIEGSRVTEEAVRVGPLGLFGIMTKPSRRHGPLVVFLNAATEGHLGPARQWVEMARRLAQYGFQSVRIDLSGLGDSPTRPGHLPRQAYAAHAVDDIHDVAVSLSPDDPGAVVLIGLCSGAYAALRAAPALGAMGVIAINPVLDITVDASSASEVPAPPIASPRSVVSRAALKHPRLKRLILRSPPSIWRAAHHLHLQRSPATGFEHMAGRVGTVLVICGARDAEPYARRGAWIIRRLNKGGQLELRTVRTLDHGLLGRSGREEVIELVSNHLLNVYGAEAGPSSPSVAMSAPGPRP